MATENRTSGRISRYSGRRSLAAVGLILAVAGPIMSLKEGDMRKYLRAYPDVVYGWSLPTVCEGHTGPDVTRTTVFTLQQCQDLKSADLIETFMQLDKCMRLDMEINQLAAFLLLAINNGAARVCRSTIPTKVKQYRMPEACATILEFYKAGGKDCRDRANNCYGIVLRRQDEYTLCMTPSPLAT
jgi:lysozyme